MQPKQILNLAQSSQWIDGLRGRGTAEAFIIAWVSWEGLKNRLLTIGLAQLGWQVKDSNKAIATCGVHSKADYAAAFTLTFGKQPPQLAGLGQTWTKIEKLQTIRNHIIHGSRLASPAQLLEGSQLIASKVLNTNWLDGMNFRVDGSTFKLPDPYARVRVHPTMRRSLESLLEPLQVCLDNSRSKRN